jgi:cyclophilin family peptidyl-prolyl cis-trans isomerase
MGEWGLFLLMVLAQAARPAFFTSPYPLEQMKNKQAVVETDAGTFVIQLLPEAAPNHVGHFLKLAHDGAYSGTIFHRVIRYGIIQGGDPLSKEPAKAAEYGRGGLNELKAEINPEKHTAGAVAAVLAPGNRDSAGAQFFICATDQPALDGQYTVFGRVVEGLEVVQQISAADADANGAPKTRITIRSVTIRDTPPPKIEPFVNDTPAQLGAYRAVLETSKGAIELQMLSDLAPETVRNFLRLAEAGVYDGVAVHRVVPNFVIQTGALGYRSAALTAVQQKLVHNLQPEFSNTPNVPGVVSMARGDDPASASTSFFICVGECHSLDGKYTVFAKVSAGMDVLNAIANTPVDGETPKEEISLKKVRLEHR